MSLFRAGNEEAFRVIHDRYRQRLFAYTRQMLTGSRPDAEDALQDVFVARISGLRANDRDVALRAWLYRDRPQPLHRRAAPSAPSVATEAIDWSTAPIPRRSRAAEQRESLRRLIADVSGCPSSSARRC